jgi:hypothetical protein
MTKKIREDIRKSFRYVGLTQDDMQDCHIKDAVLNILEAATTTRITHAKKYTYSVATMQELNGKPVVEITLFCKAEDQYCSSCDGYGCPGGC